MAAYTIEDIELIRRKSGISYQEAVALLDYHNGNIARALVDLERNGRINEGGNQEVPKSKQQGFSATVNGKPVTKSTVMELLHKCFRARVKIRRDDTPIINVSALFAVLAVMISPHLVIIGAIIALVLGYKFSFDKHDHAFDGENLERTVRNAAENVKHSVNDFTKSFQSTGAEKSEEKAEEKATEERSYYAANRPEPTYRPSYPTMNVPVQVESQDGNVTIESDSEGYSSATVE
ncbi:MAG: DUF4342 domain-containing protein [Clostridia bacterium]|nr:DUF4342 domain-containing protein [Clostridia bacterium]